MVKKSAKSKVDAHYACEDEGVSGASAIDTHTVNGAQTAEPTQAPGNVPTDRPVRVYADGTVAKPSHIPLSNAQQHQVVD